MTRSDSAGIDRKEGRNGRQAQRRSWLYRALRAASAALLLLMTGGAWAQQVLGPNQLISTGVTVGQVRATWGNYGCTTANGFPTGMTFYEHRGTTAAGGDGAGFTNLDGSSRAIQRGCTPYTMTEGASVATLTPGTQTFQGPQGLGPTGNSTTTASCPAGQVMTVVGGNHRVFVGGSGDDYPTTVFFRCSPLVVTAGDWPSLNLAATGGMLNLGNTIDGDAGDVPGPLLGNVTLCSAGANQVCNQLIGDIGGVLLDGLTGSSSNLPNARVSQKISFVNMAWPQTLGTSTDTAAWRPTVAGVVFEPPNGVNDPNRYQQTYETYTISGTSYSGGVSPPAGASTFSYFNAGTCATPHVLGAKEDYMCTNVVTGRPDLQVAVAYPATGWTAHGTFQNVTLTAQNFGPAPTTGSDNSTAVLTLPAGWDAGTLPANCAKAGSPVAVTCQVNPTPLAASSAPGATDGGHVDFVIPVTPLASVAVGSYPLTNGAKVCVQAATPGNVHVCTVPNDGNPGNDDGVNVSETALVILAYQAPVALPPTITTTVISKGGVGTFTFLGGNGALPAPNNSITTTTAGVGETAPTKTLVTPGVSTPLIQTVRPPDFVLTNISCTGLAPGGTATYNLVNKSVTLDAAATAYGAAIACTFTDVRLAVTVHKVSQGDTGTFAFTGTNGFAAQNITTTAAGTPADAGQSSLTTLGAATTITEAAPTAGWALSGASCTGMGVGGTATPNLTTRSIALSAAATAAGSDINCTFTNTKLPTVQVAKQSVGGTGTFNFTLGGVAPTTDSVTTATSGTTVNSAVLHIGTIATAATLTETAAAGYTTATSCVDANSAVTGNTTAVTSGTNAVTIPAANMKAGAQYTCQFTNTKPTVTLKKVIVGTPPDGGLFNLAVAGGNASGGTNPANNQGNGGTTGAVAVDAASLLTLSETAGTGGTSLANYSSTFACVNGAGAAYTTGVSGSAGVFKVTAPAATAVGAARDLVCTITNTVNVLPTVTIHKISTNGIGTFDFTGSNGLTAQSITTAVAGTAASGLSQTLAVANTATTITEGVPPAGFALTAASCVGMGPGGTATLSGRVLSLNAAATAPGSNLVCTFTNTGSTVIFPPNPPAVSCTSNAAIFNTGYNGVSGPPLSGGRDTVWESGAGTPGGGPGSVAVWQRALVGNMAPGAWINSPFGNANWNSNYDLAGQGPSNVDVYHRFTFSMAASVNPATFKLILDFYSDNSVGAVYVNGVQQSVPGVPQNAADPYFYTGFTAGHAASATLASNWHTGTNTVAVLVRSGPGAEGFLAQATSTAVCAPPSVALSKTTTGGAGGPFGFTLTNATQAAGTVSTIAAGTPVQVDGNTVAAGVQAFTASVTGAAITIAEPAVPGWNLASANCTDAGAPVGSLGTSADARTYTIPAASVQSGKALQCLFTNARSSTLTISKVSVGNVGTFGFTGSNGLAPQSITTASAGTAVAATVQTLATPGAATTVTEDAPPADFTLTAVSCTGLGAGGTATPDLAARKATLDAAATAAGSDIACTFTNTYTPPYPKVQIVKTTTGGTGSNVFAFALSGLSAPTDTITVAGAGTASGVATLVGTAGLEASIKESSPAGWPANPISASCVDAASATPAATFGTLAGNQLSIPADHMVAGANITCTFINGFGFSVSGSVFNDDGVGTGTANDGRINGGEPGIAGVNVRLTDCAAATFATAVTDGAGRYALAVPFSTAAGAPLCVEETNPVTLLSTGASIGATQLPSGAAVNSGGTSYSYTRAGTPDRIAFTWNGTGHAALNFGDVGLNTLAANGAKGGLPDSTVTYPHTFTAQTGGAVSFGIASSVATPALDGWAGKIFADIGCTGVLQAGAALLYPPSVPVDVAAGQSLCILMQEFIPANAANGSSDTSAVQASFVFTNAGPSLSASYTVTDITTVSNSALDLKKEVRNLTQGTSFGINNQARSGETLEYRITYTNNGSTPITNMTVNDTTPSYTTFVGALAGTTPATLTACTKNTPANPAPAAAVPCATAQTAGGTGPLDWKFTGTVAPGGGGAVLFQVKVD